MAMGAASIGLLMMVSLQAVLLLVVAAAAAVSGGTATICLPSEARAGAGVAADLVSRAMARAKLVGDKKRPWKCCDLAVCTRSYPPICQCLDQVRRCSDACKNCEETEDSHHVCTDKYWGDPGPMCHKDDGNGRRRGGAGGVADDARLQAAAAVAAVVADGKKGNDDDDDGKRPWECCDLAVWTMSIPPICRCFDKLDRCSHACKECEETEDSRHVCFDMYKGDPGPMCHQYQRNGRGGSVYTGLAGAGKAASAEPAAAVMADIRKNSGGSGGGGEGRPWKCCDVPICTTSWPPLCFCADTVERCPSTCKHCEQVEEEGSGRGSHRYRCFDRHQGDPGPSCGEEAGGDHDWARRLAAARGHRF